MLETGTFDIKFHSDLIELGPSISDKDMAVSIIIYKWKVKPSLSTTVQGKMEILIYKKDMDNLGQKAMFLTYH